MICEFVDHQYMKAAQKSVTQIIELIVINLVTPKAAVKQTGLSH